MENNYEAIFGFDGYLDSIYHVLSGRNVAGDALRYKTKADFARAIGGASSADIELERIIDKRGGNAPICAEALARLGVKTLCMGMTGGDALDPIFETDCSNLTHYPLGEPARTVALEFGDSKLMMADVSGFHALDFDALLARVGLDKLKALFFGAKLIGLVNYCACANMDKLWRGLRLHVLNSAVKTDKRIYFDLSDPSRRTEDELKACIALINDFSRGYETALSLNLNEARRVSVALGLGILPLGDMAEGIFTNTDVDCVLAHNALEAFCVSKSGTVSVTPQKVSSPAVLTGAGDTFGAGYCLGWLRAFSMERRLELACEAARLYIERGDMRALNEGVAAKRQSLS